MAQYQEYLPGEKYATTNAEFSNDHEDFKDAGLVLKPDDLVVDIDSIPKESIRVLIDKFDIQTQTVWTDRGAHLYFKRPKGFSRIRGKCALGFEVEYKWRKEKAISLTIKRNGVLRDIENWGVKSEFPQFFYPGRYEEFTGMDEGSRNELLHKHKRKINAFPRSREILEFINYELLGTPLLEEEFEVVAREEEFTAQKGEENITADIIMREKDTHLYQGSIFLKDHKNYTKDEDDINRMVYEYCVGMPTRYVDEVKKQIYYRCPKIDSMQDNFKIKLSNGYLQDGEFFESSWNGFTPFFIDIKYDPEKAPEKIVDDYLDLISDYDPEYRDYLLEVIANTLITNKSVIRSIAKFYILVGDGGNGKGTFLQIIKRILDPKNCGSLSLSQMKDERYLNMLVGKLTNLGDDIENKPIDEESGKLLKNLSTADIVSVRSLYKNAQTVELIATLIFTSNHVLRSFDKSPGLERRITWLPMYGKPKKVNPHFVEEVTSPECLEYWLKLIVEAYMRLYKRGSMPECKRVNDFKQSYNYENNNCLIFLDEIGEGLIEGFKPSDVFDKYSAWCEDNGETTLSKKLLTETIRRKFGLVAKVTTKNGKSRRVYKREDDTR